MTHVVRAWRHSPRIRLFVLLALVGTVTQLLLSQDRVVRDGIRQTKVIGRDRLVSVQPLPEMGSEVCFPATGPERLMAASSAPESLTAVLQQSRTARSATASAPSRPSDAVKSDVARRQPLSI